MWRRQTLGQLAADTDLGLIAGAETTTVESRVPRDPDRCPAGAIQSPAETRSSPTLEHLRGREHVPGHQGRLSRDPAQSAHDLITGLSLIDARRWILDVYLSIIRDG
jgi:hypothetical protein